MQAGHVGHGLVHQLIHFEGNAMQKESLATLARHHLTTVPLWGPGCDVTLRRW